MELVHRGKVKDVYRRGDDLLFRFSDRISVFDKIIPTEIAGKGASLCGTAATWFRRLGDAGIRHHLLGLEDATTMRVRPFRVPHDWTPTPKDADYFIPLEVVVRHYVAGSFHDRLRSGKADPTAYGLRRGEVEYGAPLPEPVLEFTTKLEKVDRLLSQEEAKRIGGLTDDEVGRIRQLVLRVDRLIQGRMEPAGLTHVDGKKELAFDAERNLVLVDTFGTADEDRWWVSAEGAARWNLGPVLGEVPPDKPVEFSKEFVRQHYRQTGYHGQLAEARAKGRPEPPIPSLPAVVQHRVARLYGIFYEVVSGEPLASFVQRGDVPPT